MSDREWETFRALGQAKDTEIAQLTAQIKELQEQLKKVTEERNELRAALRNRAG
jgi:hypothetical protein